MTVKGGSDSAAEGAGIMQSALFFFCFPTAAAGQCCRKLLIDEGELSLHRGMITGGSEGSSSRRSAADGRSVNGRSGGKTTDEAQFSNGLTNAAANDSLIAKWSPSADETGGVRSPNRSVSTQSPSTSSTDQRKTLSSPSDVSLSLSECSPRSRVSNQQAQNLSHRPRQTYEDGRTYEGQWLGNVRQGHGIERSKFGDFVYEGQFADDQYEGEGCMRWSNGAHYVGKFRANAKSGQGREKYASGDEYQGCFEEGLPHGQGIYISKDGAEIQGHFEFGKLVRLDSSCSSASHSI